MLPARGRLEDVDGPGAETVCTEDTSVSTVVPGESATEAANRKDERRLFFERLRVKTANRTRPVSFPNSSLSSVPSPPWASLRKVPSDPATDTQDNDVNERTAHASRPLPDLPTAIPPFGSSTSVQEPPSPRHRRPRSIRPVSFFDVRSSAQSSPKSNASYVRPHPGQPFSLSTLLVPPPPILYPSYPGAGATRYHFQRVRCT